MDAILSNPITLALLQFAAGFILKRNPNFNNKFIPLVTLLLSVFGYSVVPAAHAGVFDSLGGFFTNFTNGLLPATLQWLVVTGMHGTWKNFIAQGLVPAVAGVLGPKPPVTPGQ